MASLDTPIPTIADQMDGDVDVIPDAALSFPDPDTSPDEFLAFLNGLIVKDLALAWEHLGRRPGRIQPSNLFDEECVQAWTDRMDIFIVSYTFLSPFTLRSTH